MPDGQVNAGLLEARLDWQRWYETNHSLPSIIKTPSGLAGFDKLHVVLFEYDVTILDEVTMHSVIVFPGTLIR